ncbi:MAG: uroporphyrinogen decarboxylase [Hyphomicrobiaceae bacterium]
MDKRLAGSPLLRCFAGEAVSPPPVWLMRQAGRYLPEYRKLRAQAGSFLDLCYAPALAAEVTLQPIRRFGFDAAILFADILIVPHALGQAVTFAEGEGPRLDPIGSAGDLARLSLSATADKFARICETVDRVRRELPPATALIGFCGAPWTVATYMVAGRGSPDQAAARLWAYRDPEGFGRLIDILVEASVTYLSGQIDAGADLVQVFDTWAGSLPDPEFQRWVIAPTRALVARLKARHPTVPVIGFPRGAGTRAAAYVAETGVDGLGCDTAQSLGEVRNAVPETIVLQGNIDPLLLLAGGSALETRVLELKAAMASRPYIVNLGHGIVPETPPEHVALLVDAVRRAEGGGAGR